GGGEGGAGRGGRRGGAEPGASGRGGRGAGGQRPGPRPGAETSSSIADAARAAAELAPPGLLGGVWHDAFIAPRRARMPPVATTVSDPLRQADARRYQRGRRRLDLAQLAVATVLTLVGAAAGGWLERELATPRPLLLD